MKENLYKIVDSFLVEAKDQDGNERSLERLNRDRHLAVQNILVLVEKFILDWSTTPKTFPERESDNFDQGYAQAQEDLLKIIKTL